MNFKKTFAVLTLCAALGATLLPTMASAHRSHYKSNKAHAACTISNCTKTSTHRHHGVTYSGHYSGHR